MKALALWPKGDGWGGGGHFESRTRIALNHRDGEMALAAGFSIPRWLKVRQFGERPGWGEDDPVCSERLRRDGWKLLSGPTETKVDFDAKVCIEFLPALSWRKANPDFPKHYSLDMTITGLIERDGPAYLTEHAVNRENGEVDKLGRSDWADWSHTGDLLFAKNGCIYRAPLKKNTLTPLEDAVKLADFTKLKFEARNAPDIASRWPKR